MNKIGNNQQQYIRSSIEHIESEDEDIENQSRMIDSSKDETFFSQQSRQQNRSNYLLSGKNRGQGNNILTILKKVDRLNLRTNEIEQVSDLPTGLMNSACCEIRGVIYVIGGKDSINTCLDSIYKYDIHSNIWQIAQCKLWQPLHSLSCIAVGFNQILVLGGITSVEHGVKDIQVIDVKNGSTKKIATSSVDNLAPLLFSHTSQKNLIGKEIYLFDKNHIQCLDVVSNFDSYLVKEITPISSIQKLKDSKQIYGIFSNKLLDNSALSIQAHYSTKQNDTIVIFGNDKNQIQIQYDMKVLKYKVTEQSKNFQFLQSSSACCIEQDNSIMISGGMDSEQIYPTISIFKNYQYTQLKQVQLSLPRFLHTSIYYQNKVYFIGGKSYSNQKMQKQLAPYSSASTASSNSPNTSYNSDDKQTKYACSSECEALDLQTQQITKIAQLNFPRSNIQAVILLECIYVFAGFGGDKRLRSIERFIISENKWEIIDCYLNSDLESYQLCKISPFEVLIVGGKENGINTSKIYIFNAKFHTLTLSNIKLTYDFNSFKCAIYNDDLFIFGNNQNQSQVLSYNLRNGYEDTKLPNVQQFSQMELSWVHALTKSN